ncbi:MAG TPA: LysR substrate-binding domain-containing protein [Magnetospirillaceae bacterium]|nr:LysR substrate-binding domain-containing protein [Magnetospirillaceae bacterium]
MKLPPLLPLRVFEVVSRHASIRSAAEELCIDHTAVSRHLKSLQAAVQTQLVRTNRTGVALTAAGERYAAAVRRALIEINTATSDLHRGHRAGSLSIWSRSGFAAHVLTPRLADFQRLYPAVEVSLRPSEEDPDFSENQADVHIRWGVSPASEVCQVELCRPSVYVLASPGWLERNKRPRTVSDLRRCRLIQVEGDCWNDWLADHGVKEHLEASGPNAWNTYFALEAAKAGQGLALSNELIAQPYLEQGQLMIIDIPLPSTAPAKPYMLVAHRDLWADPAVAGFRRWLTALLAARQAGVAVRQAAS